MKSTVKLSLIVARARNGVIGRQGELPWRLAADLAFFKSATLDHPIIMGRKTWQSLPKRPLPKRDNIVVTRNWSFTAPGARVYTALAPAIEAGKALARAKGHRQAFIIGGEALYNATVSIADLLYITEVDTEVEGDAHFPNFDESVFEEINSRQVAADADNDHAFRIRILKRRS
ncbi:MAG: dihydrofolate reductase [Alphaproteobacteria bacterium]|nr:dihydrofolate reductase [Alphaproteobacteria bacterium]